MTADETPEAVYLESGDIVLMTGGSRLRYHGVPKIIRAHSQPWNEPTVPDAISFNPKNDLTCMKKTENETPYEDEYRVTMNEVQEEEFWRPFNEFISEARINLNVRQVM